MNSYNNINYLVRIFSLIIVLFSQFLIFGSISSESSFYSWIIISFLFVWNFLFILMRKNGNVILAFEFINCILSASYLFISKNPFGILLSFMVPVVTSIQFLQSYFRYILIAISLIFSFLGLSGIISLFSDPIFPNLFSFLLANFMISMLVIFVFFMINKIILNFLAQFENYREQNELLVSNIAELENRIFQYEKQMEALKNEIEQERIAFNVEIEKVVRDFQNRKDETYTQLKALNNELILKDKAIQELTKSLNDMSLDIEEVKSDLQRLRNILFFIVENIDDFQSLYKVSEDIIEIVTRFVDYDTMVIFIKNEIEGSLDTFLVSGENAEFYYNYKKIEMEELYRYTYVEGKIGFAYKDNDVPIQPFYPKEQLAISVPIDVANSRMGMLYISYLDKDKYKNLKEDFLIDLANLIGIMLYTAILYSKSINRVIWDDRLFCYSPDFIWEFINNLSFSAKRYNENFALVFISFHNIFGKDLQDLNDEQMKFIREVNLTIRSVIRETDMISFIGNGIIIIVLSKVDKDKVDSVCKRIKNMVDSKLNLLGYSGESYMICSVYPYKDIEISQLVELSIERLSKNMQYKKVIIEVVKV
ncbi:MAG: hypothetical protein RMJ36_00115 [Candidatus Calescibacterium sp.]|nr:hypothetical protein [Candidatus Calescibacterium sp.]MDW8132049.1 hypothetical protein [Candidatus Calescibacterium sp.]